MRCLQISTIFHLVNGHSFRLCMRTFVPKWSWVTKKIGHFFAAPLNYSVVLLRSAIITPKGIVAWHYGNNMVSVTSVKLAAYIIHIQQQIRQKKLESKHMPQKVNSPAPQPTSQKPVFSTF